jgi:hypothetical protein
MSLGCPGYVLLALSVMLVQSEIDSLRPSTALLGVLSETVAVEVELCLSTTEVVAHPEVPSCR